MANELTIFIDADTSGLRQGLEQAERQVETFQSRIQGIADIGQKLAGLGATLTAGLTVPIVGLGIASVKAYGDIQALKKGLEAVMGSADGANSEFERLKEVAKLPGLGMQEAVKGSINLQAIGISAGRSRDILQQFGNAVATVGKGRVEFERAIYGVQQLANTDFPLGEDLNIIKDALPQVSSLLKDAFGTSRSDELTKLGISSKEVLDVILSGLGKLPRVSGGIKGAFENLSDAMQTSLGRIGKVIDDNLDISGIIDKITDVVDKVISKFESLDPTLQKVILTIAGVTAVAGPLLLAVGGFMALLPTLTAGVTALGAVFGALLSPIGLVTVAIVGLVGAVVANWGKIRPYLDDTVERFKTLYKESTIFRLGITTLGASIEGFARSSFSVLNTFYRTFVDLGKGVLNIFKGIGEGIEGVMTFDVTKIAKGFARVTTAPLSFISDMTRNSISGVAELNAIFVKTFDKWKKLDVEALKIEMPKLDLGEDVVKSDKLTTGLQKVKKETQKQLAEIFPVGSIAELQQRAGLLKKAIETSNNDIIKIRGLDKFGSDKTKEGLPVYTGEILARQQAVDRLADLNMLIGEELKPVKIEPIGLMDVFGNEYKTFNDFFAKEAERTGMIANTIAPSIKFGLDNIALESIRFQELTEQFSKSFNNLISSSISSSLTDLFSSIGQAIGEGGNVIQTIGNSLLDAFGGFLSDMGKMLIEYGTLAVVKGTLDLIIQTGGYQAIVAGVAAIAVGAALSVAGGALGSRANKGMNGGVSGSTGSSAQSNYSSSYTSGFSGGGEIVLRLSGRDAVALINRNVLEQDRLNAG